MEFIKNQQWRYATKQFDSSRKVATQELNYLKEAIRLSVSSYGLQLYEVLIIENPELRQKLKPASWNQSQITDASHLFVFCNYTSVQDRHIEDYTERVAKARGLSLGQLNGYGDFVKNKLAEKSATETQNWLERQPYIALANLLAACAELEIDACPMEGFDPQAYQEILDLAPRSLHPCVIATVGYRHKNDASQHQTKVRKTQDELFTSL